MKKLQFLLITILSLLSCSTMKNQAQVSLNEVKFAVAPYISNRDGNYYLVYQIDTPGNKIQNRLMIGSKIKDQKGYYFFIGQTSFREFGNLIESPIKEDLIPSVASHSIFWLNPDNSEVKLSIR